MWNFKLACGGPSKGHENKWCWQLAIQRVHSYIIQVNWNVIQIMFDPSGDPSQPLHNKKITCIFH